MRTRRSFPNPHHLPSNYPQPLLYCNHSAPRNFRTEICARLDSRAHCMGYSASTSAYHCLPLSHLHHHSCPRFPRPNLLRRHCAQMICDKAGFPASLMACLGY